MRKLILKMSVSIDGFVGGPNGEIDWIFKGLDEGVLINADTQARNTADPVAGY